jgi:chromosome segregation ATPase
MFKCQPFHPTWEKVNTILQLSNLSIFIDSSNAEISVVLCNQGLEAIDVERFGRSITITRRISIQGASRYLIKNEFGSFR